jgi:deoxyadenosine/deoxycytidine kinase
MKICPGGVLTCRSSFLNSRLNQLLDIHRGTETVIQDRTIYEDANIFAPNLHDMGLMGKRDFENYYSFF